MVNLLYCDQPYERYSNAFYIKIKQQGNKDKVA